MRGNVRGVMKWFGVSNRCEFVQARFGLCGKMRVIDSIYCDAHLGVLCLDSRCERQASRICGEDDGELWCSVPLCGEHRHIHT